MQRIVSSKDLKKKNLMFFHIDKLDLKYIDFGGGFK